jgi:hypothetical protein
MAIYLFLEKYYPQELDRFYVDFLREKTINDVKKLKNILSIVKNKIDISYCDFSDGTFKNIIRYSHKWNKISFSQWDIIYREENKENEVDWSEEFSISSIDLYLDSYNLTESDEKLKAKKIIEFIGNSGLKNSLKKLKLKMFDIKKSIIKELCIQNGINVDVLETNLNSDSG